MKRPEINRERFEAWLFSQPKNRIIDLGDTEECLLCSFVAETSNERIKFRGWREYDWVDDGGPDYCIPPKCRVPEWFDKNLVERFKMCDGDKCKVTFGFLQHLYINVFGFEPEPILPDISKPLTNQERK